MANIIPERLKALRITQKEAQADLAAVIEKDRAMISNFERGTHDPTVEDLVKIARHYNVSPDYLLGWSNVRLPLQEQQASHQFDERALTTAMRRVLNEAGSPVELLRLKGTVPDRRRETKARSRKSDDRAS